MIDRFTVTNAAKYYQSHAQGAPTTTVSPTFSEPQDYVFDNRTGALTVCNIPPSVSHLQNHGGFNFTA